MPADAEASEVVDSTLVAEPVPAAAALGSALHDARRAQSDSEVPEDCTVTACCHALRALPYGLLRAVQVPAAASSSVRDLPPHGTRPEHELPSYAWLDTTESIAADSNQHDLASVASSLVQPR